MGTLYTSQSAAGYNASPPPDDGSQVASNQITWGTTIKAKIGDPIKALADAINTQLTTVLDLSPRAISTADSAVASDHWRTLQVTGTTTITLSDAATMTNKYVVGIANLGVATVTVTRATAGNTINGTAADFTLAPKQAVVLGVNQAANGYNILSHSLASGAGINTIQATTSLVTPLVDSGTTGSLSLKTNNGSTQFSIRNVSGTIVNFLSAQGNVTGSGPFLGPIEASDTDVPVTWYTKGVGTHNFATQSGTTIQFQILNTTSATRNITVTGSNGGNPTIAATAGSPAITYSSAGGSGTPTNHTFAMYEEGTWVPSLGGTTTYTSQAGIYTKVGNLVFFQGIITVNAIGSGSTTAISGLPFTADSTHGFTVSVGAGSSGTTMATAVVSVTGSIGAGSTTITLRSRTAAATSDGSNPIFQNGTTVIVSGCYSV